MTLHRRRFGRTGWDVSEVSFGAWQLGGQWGPVDDDASVRALLDAYERGINFVDTAQMYGSGHSEEVIGRSLRVWDGERIHVATKVQPLRWPDVSDSSPDIVAAYPPAYLREQVEQSLRRIGVDRIDLLQLHCWMPNGMQERGWLDTLEALREEGKIERIGVSLRDYRADDGLELAGSGLVDSIQVVYNIFEQSPATSLLSTAAGSGTAIIARVALDSGSLGGTWTPATYDAWPEGSVLRSMFRGERFGQTLQRIAEIREVTDAFYSSLDEAAVRFVLDRPQVSTTVIGMTSVDLIERNVAFGDGRGLAAGLGARLSGLGWKRNFYV